MGPGMAAGQGVGMGTPGALAWEAHLEPGQTLLTDASPCPCGPLYCVWTDDLDLAADLSCIVLFGACIEGVVLRDKCVGFHSGLGKLCGQHPVS